MKQWRTLPDGRRILINISDENRKEERKISIGSKLFSRKPYIPRFCKEEEPCAGPAICPICGQSVYFIRAWNGGAFWCESLGVPWPKHPCMDVINRKNDCYRKDISELDLNDLICNINKNVINQNIQKTPIFCVPRKIKFHSQEEKPGIHIPITDMQLDSLSGQQYFIRLSGHDNNYEFLLSNLCIIYSDFLETVRGINKRRFKLLKLETKNGILSKEFDIKNNKFNKNDKSSKKPVMNLSYYESKSNLEKTNESLQENLLIWRNFIQLLRFVICGDSKSKSIASFLKKQPDAIKEKLCSSRSDTGSFLDIFYNENEEWLAKKDISISTAIKVINELKNPLD